MPKRTILAAAFLVLAVPGCFPPGRQPPPDAMGRPLENQYQDELIFSDIPVPRYFAYEPRESFKKVFLDKGNVRIAHLVYRGSSHVKDVVRFYDEHMTAQGFGWKKVREELVRGTGAHVLVFNKSSSADRVPEECKITAVRERGQTVVAIDVQ